MKIPYVNIKKQYNSEKKKLLKIIDKALHSGSWVGGSEIEKFEKNISKICKTKYCVSLNSGTFSEGENIVGSSSSAIYTLKSYDTDTSSSDQYSDNDEFEVEADKILDFTETNPFGTY